MRLWDSGLVISHCWGTNYFCNGGIRYKVTIITYIYWYFYTVPGAKGFTCMISLCIECYFPHFIDHIVSVWAMVQHQICLPQSCPTTDSQSKSMPFITLEFYLTSWSMSSQHMNSQCTIPGGTGYHLHSRSRILHNWYTT